MKTAQYGPTVLRIFLGLLLLIPGLSKLSNPSGIIGMLGGLGFPAPVFFGWLVLLSEILFGLAVIIGYLTKYAVWPLAIILLVAAITVYLPNISQPGGIINILFHLSAIAGLVSLYLTGPGAYALDKH